MSIVISKEAMADLKEVCAFFGIDLEWNAHIFRRAAQVNDGAFAQTMKLMAEAVRDDKRHGVSMRMREAAAKEREKNKGAGAYGRKPAPNESRGVPGFGRSR